MTTKPTFQEDLIRLMSRHRFKGLPAPAIARIREASTASDQETLNEWLPHAVAKMINQREQR